VPARGGCGAPQRRGARSQEAPATRLVRTSQHRRVASAGHSRVRGPRGPSALRGCARPQGRPSALRGCAAPGEAIRSRATARVRGPRGGHPQAAPVSALAICRPVVVAVRAGGIRSLSPHTRHPRAWIPKSRPCVCTRWEPGKRACALLCVRAFGAAALRTARQRPYAAAPAAVRCSTAARFAPDLSGPRPDWTLRLASEKLLRGGTARACRIGR